MNRSLSTVIAAVLLAGGLSAQTFDRRANIVNRGPGDRDRCVVQVVVDGAAQVSIRGDRATVMNLSGQAPQLRRFECSSPLPGNAPNFNFRPVDGRGRQELVRAPDGGPAVVRIEDSEGGADSYTFELTWGSPFREARPVPAPPPVVSRQFTTDQAIQACREEVRRQAFDRFQAARDVEFRRINLDDNPGRNDWVVGAIDVRFRDDRREPYRFSCSVNFDTGDVRNVDIQRMDDRSGDGYRDRDGGAARAIDSCRRRVQERIASDGYDRPNVTMINVDNRPGRNDWVIGQATALGRGGRQQYFDFSCSVDLGDGDVRSVDVNRR